MKNTYSPEIRQRAVRLYQEQRSEYPTQWAAIVSIASKFGCTPETLRTWIKKSEADSADNGLAANQAQLIKQQERQIKELQRANEILRKAAVESTGQRNTLFQYLLWGFKVKCFSRSFI